MNVPHYYSYSKSATGAQHLVDDDITKSTIYACLLSSAFDRQSANSCVVSYSGDDVLMVKLCRE